VIGLLIIAHQPLASALLAAASHVTGVQPQQCAAYDLVCDECPAEILPRVQALLAPLNTGDGVLVLTDIYGASPANLTSQLVTSGVADAVTGVNLAMVVRALTSRSQGREHLLKRVVSGACEGIFQIEADAQHGCRISTQLAGQMKAAA
jgi:mannose PTS system EIIA component